jgi:hypothetical protein
MSSHSSIHVLLVEKMSFFMYSRLETPWNGSNNHRQCRVIIEHSEVETARLVYRVFFSVPSLDQAPGSESRPSHDVGQSMIQLCCSRHLQLADNSIRVLLNRNIFYKYWEYSDETLVNFQERFTLPFLLRVFHPSNQRAPGTIITLIR